MHLETALYTALGTVINNEVLIYNLIWLFGFLGTGMGTYLLAWYVVRDRACAGFGGLAAMLSTPMMIHGQGHLELIQLGAIPVFLIAWLRFVDRPTSGRMLLAWAGFGLIAASAAYYAVLSTIPAAWYVAWRTLSAARRGEGPWLGPRVAPLVRFSILAAPVLFVLFSSQIWAASHGFAITRSYSDFRQSGTPLWGYAVPTVWHGLGRLFPVEPYQAMGYVGTHQYASASYLGLASLLLIAHAAIRRVDFPRSGYWWSAFGVMAILAMGATLQVGGFRVSLPASWLWSVFLPFRLIRVPARFNLLVCVVAAVLAAAGLRDLRRRLTRAGARAAWFAVVAVAVADLTLSPFTTSRIPPIPPGYAVIDRAAPRATVLDAPLVSSGDPHPLSALCAYWQSRRGGRSSAGYSGHANQVFDQLFVHDSPFGGRQLADPSYLLDPARQSFGVIADVPFLDYAWLYLTVHRVDYVVLHHWVGSVHIYPVRLDRLMSTLSGARIAEDEATTIYDRERLPRPSGFVGLCTEGWISWPGGYNRPARGPPDGPDRGLQPRPRPYPDLPAPGLVLPRAPDGPAPGRVGRAGPMAGRARR